MVTYDMQQIRLYVDGALERSVAENRYTLPLYGLYIGTTSYGTSTIVYGSQKTFSGLISNLRLYNYGLSTGDAIALHS